MLTFKTNKFSTYALAYTDTLSTVDSKKARNPKTGDLIIRYLVLFIASAGLLTYINNKRKITN